MNRHSGQEEFLCRNLLMTFLVSNDVCRANSLFACKTAAIKSLWVTHRRCRPQKIQQVACRWCGELTLISFVFVQYFILELFFLTGFTKNFSLSIIAFKNCGIGLYSRRLIELKLSNLFAYIHISKTSIDINYYYNYNRIRPTTTPITTCHEYSSGFGKGRQFQTPEANGDPS